MTPSIGMLLKFGPPAFRLMRVIDILEPDRFVLYEVCAKKRTFNNPEIHLISDVTEDVRIGIIEIVLKDHHQPLASLSVNREELSPTQQAVENRKDARLREASKVVADLLAQAGTAIYERSGYRHFTKLAATTSGHRQQVVRRWLNTYWRGGAVPEALRPDYSKVGLVKTHRPNDDTSKYWMEPETLEALKQFVIETAASKLSNKKKHVAFLEKYFVEGVDMITSDGIVQKRLLPRSQYPSFENFKKHFYRIKNKNSEEFAKKKHGDIEFSKNHRPLTGSSIARTHGPGSKFEFDFTIASVDIVSRLDRTQILGKPVLGIAWDVYTGGPAGLLTTLERSSEMQLRLLVENTLTDKVEFCARYGITIQPEDWPMCHVPKAVICDRGEGKGEIGDQFADRFRLTWINLPRSRPDLKPTVESGFSKMEREVKFVPGWEPQYWKRDDPDTAGDAVLTLDEFTQLVIRILLLHLKSANPDRYVDPTFRQCRPGVPPSPINLWTFGLQNINLLRQELDPDLRRLKTFPQASAQITKSGIRFKGLEYEHPDLADDFVRARSTGNRPTTLLFTSHTVNHVWYRPNKRANEFLTCSLTESSRAYAGLTHPELQIIRQRERDHVKSGSHETLELQMNSLSAMKQVIAQARTQTLQAKKEAGMGSKQYSKKNMRQARTDEANERIKESLVASTPTPALQPSTNVLPFPGPPTQPERVSAGDDSAGLDQLEPSVAKYLKNYKKNL